MRSIALLLGVFGFIGMIAFSGPARAADEPPQAVLEMAQGELAALGTDPVIVAAVKAENAKGKTLDQIKATDTEWCQSPGVTPFMKAMMESPCAQKLRALQTAQPFLAELFVMDNLGANVAMSDKTSDYWQGDEPKFTESYKGGQGAVHLSKIKFDDSSQTYTVQVSVPVKDGDAVIGALTVGIDIDKLEEHLAQR